MIDYLRWDKVDWFSLENVAYLWCGLEPVEQSKILRRLKHPETDAAEKMLLSAIESEETPATSMEEGSEWYIDREDLNKLAETKGVRPAFLFPDVRSIEDNAARPPYRSPYVDLILRAEKHFGERIRRLKVDEIQDWLNREGKNTEPNWSMNKARNMATFLRHPKQQKGGARKSRATVRTNK